jgi:predicted porin
MSKKLLAAAIAAALAPAAVMAEASNVTMYGRIDYGFMSRGGDSGGNAQNARTGRLNDFEDGIGGTNRFGFKGTEDLGNGLKAIYEFEFGFSGDTGNSFGNTTNRHSWVGLTGAFGTALGGRVDGARYSFVGKYDPFKNQTVGNAGSLFGATSGLGQADRADNAVVYISPELAPGLKFLAAYTTALLATPNDAGSGAANAFSSNIENGDTPLYAIAAMYDNGPLSVTLDYENLKIKNANTLTGSDLEYDLYVAGASYDFGVVKLSAYYEKTEGSNRASRGVAGTNGAAITSDGDGWLIGLTAPVTSNVKVMASFVKANDDRQANMDCDKWAIGGEYAFSKRTTAYATYAKLNNDRNAICGLSKNAAGRNGEATGANAGGGANGTAYGDSGFNIGLAHTF